MIVKRQALADFIVVFTYVDIAEVARTMDIVEAAKVAMAQGEKKFLLG